MENFQNQNENEVKPASAQGSGVAKQENKNMPSWVGITITIIIAAIAGAGILYYQYFYIKDMGPGPLLPIENRVDDFSKLNKNDLLYKLFPNLDLQFINGTTSLASGENGPELKLSLKDSKEDYFVNPQEKSLLLIVNLEGVPHAGGLYHAFLGVFDKNGNLLTPASTFPNVSSDKIIEGSGDYDLSKDPAHFGGDDGIFSLNDCNGAKFITFIESDLPNSTCGFDAAIVYRINNGQFEEMQKVKQDDYLNYGLKMSVLGNTLTIKKVPPQLNATVNECTETTYKTMEWNHNSCTWRE